MPTQKQEVHSGVERLAIEQVASRVVEEYHRNHCPAKAISDKIDDVVKEFAGFRGEFLGQTKSMKFWIPITVTVGMFLVGGICTLAFYIMTRKDLHNASEKTSPPVVRLAQEKLRSSNAD